MRHESPLLVISPVVVVVEGSTVIVEEGGRGVNDDVNNGEDSAPQQLNVEEDTTSNNNDDERLIGRNHTARRLRAGSIPEEIEDAEDGTTIFVDNTTSAAAAASSSTTNNNNNSTRTAGRFFTQAVATNASSTRRRRNNNNNRSSQPDTTQQQRVVLSTKQNPSHRKIRRWKNDAFIGTPSEHVHTMLVSREDTLENGGWNEFPYMPNYPREYKSEFSKLSVDKTKGGEVVRERFVRGEVADADFVALKKNGGYSGDDDMEEEEEGGGEGVVMQRRIVTKCRQLGISPTLIMNENNNEWGEVLFNKLGLRIQSILSRSCSGGTNGEETKMTNASRIVSTFESYLVSLALQSKVMGNDDDDEDDDSVCMGGFPPLQSQSVYDVFDEILASPPRIVMRNKKSSSSYNYNNQRHGKATTSTAATVKAESDINECGVLIPTIHFYFPTKDQDGSSKRSSAFHRILLYAVCQFHGLETSSSERDNVCRRGQLQQQKQRDVEGSAKVVTVQGGVLLAPSVKLLDCVCT